MVKVISVSFSDYAFENCLSEVYVNRSKYIEKLMLMGANAMIDGSVDNNSKYLKLLQEKNSLEEEIKRLRFENNKHKLLNDSKKQAEKEKREELERKVARTKGIIASGLIR